MNFFALVGVAVIGLLLLALIFWLVRRNNEAKVDAAVEQIKSTVAADAAKIKAAASALKGK